MVIFDKIKIVDMIKNDYLPISIINSNQKISNPNSTLFIPQELIKIVIFLYNTIQYIIDRILYKVACTVEGNCRNEILSEKRRNMIRLVSYLVQVNVDMT